MAWILGQASDIEVAELKARDFEVQELHESQLTALFGPQDQDSMPDGERWIMVYMDADASALARANLVS